MNLLWVAIIALFVLIEKILSQIKWMPYLAGAALILYGLLIIIK